MYKSIIDSFISEHPAYKNDIDNLIEYYKVKENSNFYNENILGGVRTKQVLKSIVWLTSEKKAFHYKATANKYKNAVVTLFRKLIDEGLENADFQDQYNIESDKEISYFFQCDNYINNCDALLPSHVLNALSEEQAEYIISECDLAVDNYKHLGKRSEKEAFNNMVAALIIKLILLTGITYSNAYTIPLSAYDSKKSTIRINEFTINLPNSYSSQLEIYTKASKNFQSNELFVRYGGQQLNKKTSSSGIPNFLKKRIECTSVNILVKYSVQQLLKCEMNETILRQVTGAEKAIMQYCFKSVFTDTNRSAYVNQKLAESELFRYL